MEKISSSELQKPLIELTGTNKQDSERERVVLTRFVYSEILLNNELNGKDNSLLISTLEKLLIASIESYGIPKHLINLIQACYVIFE